MNFMKVETSEKREPFGIIYTKRPLSPATGVLLRVFMSGKLVSWALTVALGLTGGCTMKKVEDYRATAPPASVGTSEQNGLRLTVSPMLDKEETRKYFGLDALRAGILILHLHVTNGSPTSTVLLRKEHMMLVADRGSGQEEQSAQKIERRSSTGEALGTAGAAVMSMPLLYLSLKLFSDASVIQQSFMKNEFRDRTLSSGQSADGFLYFKVDPQRSFTRDTLVVKVPETAGQQDRELRIQVIYEPR
jgi:hypothetical protein